ncbi:MAG: hypothetical protein K0Q49_1340 [Haloplasmataceae bacterium]|nr:hypothetical protein [Haloplasmataceae bacterium]
MEFKERYVYAVLSKLPEKQREDIAKEIRTLIDDMMDNLEGENDDAKLEKVLLELGNPNELADKYREQTRYLIGPKYFNLYIYTLKIVVIAIVIGISVSAMVGLFSDNLAKIFINYIPNLISALTQGFIWVTVIFAIFEYTKVDLNYDKEKWSPKKLQPIPQKKARISRGETIFGIVISTAFLILFYSALFAIILPNPEGGFKFIPIFNYEKVSYFKLVILVIFLLGIAKEVLKLIYGRWNLKLAISYTVLTTISTILFIILFSNHSIWNTNIIIDIANILEIDQSKISINFDQTINIILAIGLFGSMIDIGVALYKGIKYNSKTTYLS